MIFRSIAAAAGIVVCGASLALAQAKPAPPATPNPAQATAKPAVPPPPPPRPESPLQNVRVDITITDQRGGAAPVKKTVSVVAADGLLSRIRSTSSFPPSTALPVADVPLNVDVVPGVRAAGKIRMSLTLQYDLPALSMTTEGSPGTRLVRTQISETLNSVLDDGKAMVIAQSADPISDRQVTIEVKATVLK